MHKHIIEILETNGFSAFIVGGAVRDMVRNMEPKDYDIATNARATHIVSLFPNAKIVGAAFEVALIHDIEVAPFRVDFNHDGRRADVEFVDTIETDLSRRDFTMNAMAFNISTNEIIDPFNGKDDIKYGLIRFVGSAADRLDEDLLRGVRAIRFAADFGFSLTPDAMMAIMDRAERITTEISPERFVLEFEKVKNFGTFMKYMFSLGLGKFLFPEVEALKGVTQDPDFHPEGDAFVHTMNVVNELPKNASLALKMAALLHDTGKALTTKVEDDGKLHCYGHDEVGSVLTMEVMKRFKFSSDCMCRCMVLVDRHMQLHHESTNKRTVNRLRNNFGKEFLNELMVLAMADANGSSGLRKANMKNFLLVNDAVHESAPEKVVTPLNGKEIMELLGVKPGPRVGEVKTALMEHMFGLDTPMSREEAVDFVLKFKEV